MVHVILSVRFWTISVALKILFLHLIRLKVTIAYPAVYQHRSSKKVFSTQGLQKSLTTRYSLLLSLKTWQN